MVEIHNCHGLRDGLLLLLLIDDPAHETIDDHDHQDGDQGLPREHLFQFFSQKDEESPHCFTTWTKTSSRFALPYLSLSPWGVPTSWIVPLSTIATRSDRYSISSMLWLDSSTAMPSAVVLRIDSRISMAATTSRPLVGSSMMASFGCVVTARDSSSLRVMPLLYVPILSRNRSPSPVMSEALWIYSRCTTASAANNSAMKLRYPRPVRFLYAPASSGK